MGVYGMNKSGLWQKPVADTVWLSGYIKDKGISLTAKWLLACQSVCSMELNKILRCIYTTFYQCWDISKTDFYSAVVKNLQAFESTWT